MIEPLLALFLNNVTVSYTRDVDERLNICKWWSRPSLEFMDKRIVEGRRRSRKKVVKDTEPCRNIYPLWAFPLSLYVQYPRPRLLEYINTESHSLSYP